MSSSSAELVAKIRRDIISFVGRFPNNCVRRQQIEFLLDSGGRIPQTLREMYMQELKAMTRPVNAAVDPDFLQLITEYGGGPPRNDMQSASSLTLSSPLIVVNEQTQQPTAVNSTPLNSANRQSAHQMALPFTIAQLPAAATSRNRTEAAVVIKPQWAAINSVSSVSLNNCQAPTPAVPTKPVPIVSAGQKPPQQQAYSASSKQSTTKTANPAPLKPTTVSKAEQSAQKAQSIQPRPQTTVRHTTVDIKSPAGHYDGTVSPNTRSTVKTATTIKRKLPNEFQTDRGNSKPTVANASAVVSVAPAVAISIPPASAPAISVPSDNPPSAVNEKKLLSAKPETSNFNTAPVAANEKSLPIKFSYSQMKLLQGTSVRLLIYKSQPFIWSEDLCRLAFNLPQADEEHIDYLREYIAVNRVAVEDLSVAEVEFDGLNGTPYFHPPSNSPTKSRIFYGAEVLFFLAVHISQPDAGSSSNGDVPRRKQISVDCQQVLRLSKLLMRHGLLMHLGPGAFSIQ